VNTVTALANTNIAFIKYWGKLPGADNLPRNLPAVGSLSMTLADLGTRTTVAPADRDAFILNGAAMDGEPLQRVVRFVDRVCQLHGTDRRPLRVDSTNTVPTAAGLASSASAFAALALAVTRAFSVELSLAALSGLARQGSASAARSLFGGFVELPGSRAGEEVLAAQLLDEHAWDVRLVVAKTSERAKDVSSTGGMQHTAKTSTYYPAWLATWEQDFTLGREALLARDLEKLGTAMEHSTLAMHATTMTARPPFLYWNGASVGCIHAVWELRKHGTLAFWTADAGPHVKVLCLPADAERVAAALAAVPGVIGTASHRPGRGATIV
jgi:diphosphomevalonate decarboxylase